MCQKNDVHQPGSAQTLVGRAPVFAFLEIRFALLLAFAMVSMKAMKKGMVVMKSTKRHGVKKSMTVMKSMKVMKSMTQADKLDIGDEVEERDASKGFLALKEWASAAERGDRQKKTGAASAAWVTDELKRMDKDAGNDLHLKHYKTLSNKEKEKVQLQLVLHRDEYKQYMKVFETVKRSKAAELSSKQGWRTLLQIADIEKLPPAMSTDDREELALSIASEEGWAERTHPTRKHVQQFFVTYEEEITRKDTRGKTVGYKKHANVDVDDIGNQTTGIADTIDDDFEDHLDNYRRGSKRQGQTLVIEEKKSAT